MSTRLERFKELQRKAKESAKSNRKELYEEYRKSKLDPKRQAALNRQRDQAQLDLAKLEAEQDGTDFERQRALDWTIEEAEKWDEKLEQKKGNIEGSGFSDYATAAERAYNKSIKNLTPDPETVQREKKRRSEQPEQIEDPSNLDELPGAHKPSKEAVDRLVKNLRADDERRMKRRRGNEDGNVTYINEKNKHFNQKLSRHYDKYNQEVRDALERGTAL
uniref:Pre-mRNA-splicing factor SYF2 n=1 Tax=Blastobotrys adeninivorans TaxID=409370 RepID=A0A060T5C2_BLAAD